MKKGQFIDPFLEKYLVKYDEWLNKGQISYSSKVIPISESFNTKQWVLPTGRDEFKAMLQEAGFSLATEHPEWDGGEHFMLLSAMKSNS